MKNDCIRGIVRASGVKPGEMVLVHFWGEDERKGLANEFMAAVAALGGTPVLLQQARSVNREIFSVAKADCFGEEYFERLSRFDAVLDVFAYRPVILGYELEAGQMELYRRYIRRLFGALMKAKRFTQIRIPTEENAAEAALKPGEYIARMEAAYDIDYDALLESCRRKRACLEGARRATLRTGDGCALHFDLSGRQWHIDAGDGDWPCGEIYIAPNEDATQGTVFFERLFIEDAGEFTEVTLEIRDGRLIGSDSDGVNEFIKGLKPEEAVICELGLGMNPNVRELCGYAVLDEKMAGSFHIAIGANDMFGGRNSAGMHMDMVNPGRFQLSIE